MSVEGDKAFMEKHKDTLLQASQVLAGQLEPTRELFVGLSQVLAELLKQHEGALAQIEKTKRNADKRERKASH